MHIHYEELTDVTRYIESHADLTLEDNKSTSENILRNLRRYSALDQHSRLLEIGIGMGWFQIYCRQQGLNIEGLEISPQLAEVARQIGRRYEQELDLKVGNIEQFDLGSNNYDAIIASSVFEHVEDWKSGVRKLFEALRPGGILYFDSTNKFSLVSGEYNFPLYGWLPDSWRYRLRIARQGPDIMQLGIDFHQFTHSRLRRYFKKVGFAKVMDFVDFKDLSSNGLAQWKRAVYRTLKKVRPLKHVALTFAPATIFICVKTPLPGKQKLN
ncbi:MAG TPA: class I SAM-dependent methyltransferase [Pyrinomonadaceae bacterium]|nr:class I SAM-dependent methyltransferase [Pyrinomonadaceae bacterium]